MRLRTTLLLLLGGIQGVLSIWCLDGSDCDSNCAFCEGGACIRIQRRKPAKGPLTALTCLPHDSLVHTYYPDGCRSTSVLGETMCICSGSDYCNLAADTNYHSILSITIVALFILF